MSKKKTRRKRKTTKTSKRRRTRKAPASTRSRSQRIYRQCMTCGAPVEQMYGTGESSWCPHCHDVGWVVANVGELPAPDMYGGWVLEQEELAKKNALYSGNPSPSEVPGANTPLSPFIGLGPKTPKLHTGAYCCPTCCFEINFVAEASLRCDECQGPLVSGSLDDYWKAEEDLDDEPARE